MPKKQATESNVPLRARKPPATRGRSKASKSAVPGTADTIGSTTAVSLTTKPAARRRNGAAAGNSKKASGTRTAKPVDGSPAPQDDRFREAVAKLAYHFWEVRGCQEDSAQEDWVRAENAVREVLEVIPRSSS